MKIGDIAILSQNMIKFFNDFREQEAIDIAKKSSFLIIERPDKSTVVVLSDDGDVIKMSRHDLEVV